MVCALADALGGADEIETALVLAANDVKGPASLDYFLQELSMSFDIRIDGEDLRTRAFSAPRLVEFPPPAGAQLAYLFPFSYEVLYSCTMGAKTALTRLAIEPVWLARGLAVMVRIGVSRLMAIEESVMPWRGDSGIVRRVRVLGSHSAWTSDARGARGERHFLARPKRTRPLQALQEWRDCWLKVMLPNLAPGCLSRSLIPAHFCSARPPKG